ncbi:DUF2268 domain-containing putative Zn-dependent protease [Spirochaetota bacterium]
MRYFISFLILIISIFSFRCSDGNFLDISDGAFWVFDTTKDYFYDSSAWYRIYTDRRYENSRVIVYVDRNAKNISYDDIKKLADEFKNNIYPKITENFAKPLDVDKNGKTSLVIYDIEDSFISSGDVYLGGYFSPFDFYSKGAVDQQNSIYGSAIKTNEGDIIYIDCNPQSISDPRVFTTIAHEFQHLVNTSYKLVNTDTITDTWIEEGLSEAANHMCYGNVTERIHYYNDSETSSLISNGHPLFFWDWDPDEDPDWDTKLLLNYTYSYLFFQFMKGRSSSGDGIFKNILQSQYGDYRSVQDAMDADTSLSGSEWGTTRDERFKKLLLRWYATNGGVSGTNYGYNPDDNITLTPRLLTGNSPIVLKNGSGIVKNMSGVFSSPENGYIYLSVDNNGDFEDFSESGGFSNQDKFIAVYFNPTDMNNSSEVSTPLPDTLFSSSVANPVVDYQTKSVQPSKSYSKWIDFIPSRMNKKIKGISKEYIK